LRGEHARIADEVFMSGFHTLSAIVVVIAAPSPPSNRPLRQVDGALVLLKVLYDTLEKNVRYLNAAQSASPD
jgi:hypothetical protein